MDFFEAVLASELGVAAAVPISIFSGLVLRAAGACAARLIERARLRPGRG